MDENEVLAIVIAACQLMGKQVSPLEARRAYTLALNRLARQKSGAILRSTLPPEER